MRRSVVSGSLTALVLVLLPFGAGTAQETRTIEPEDYYRVQRLSDPAISPDGRHLLYEVQTVRRETNDRIDHVWWADLETGRTRRLSTAGASSSNPGWSPDGRRVHFTTERGGESGLHFLDFLDPGGEAYRISGISGPPDFHPDGSWVLVTRRVQEEPDEEDEGGEDPAGGAGGEDGEAAGEGDATEAEMDAVLRPVWERASYWPDGTPALTGPADRATTGQSEEDRNEDVYVIAHGSYKRDGDLTFLPPRGEDRDAPQGPRQFFRVPADGVPEGAEPVQITYDDLDKSFRGFSPDGRWIVYTASIPAEAADDPEQPEEPDDPEDPDEPDEDDDETGIFRMPAEGGEGALVHRTDRAVRSLAISPDGERLAYVTADSSRADPYVVVVEEGEADRELARDDWIHSIGSLTWSPDGVHLFWTSAIGGQDQLVRVPVEGGPVEHVTEGRHTFNGFDVNPEADLIAYVKSTGERPWELFVAGLDGSGERRVSEANAEWLDEVRLSRVEHFTYEGAPHDREWLDELPERGVEYMLANDAPDGTRWEIDGWLVYPIDYEEGRSYPMLVSIHGGPHSRYGETWFPEFQMLAARGMFVLYTNPRGSSGYGTEFQYSTLRAWGIDDAKDILRGVDVVVERGLTDPDRLGITGGSYGGFMTSWITAHDQRWRAALTARGIVNWLSFYGVSDASSLVESEFGGMPWPVSGEEEGSYRLVMELSPIVWANRVETPTLIVHSINDYRTPLEGGEQWFRALQKHDVPVKMVLFPDSSHGLSRTGEPWLLVRRLHEYLNWFGPYLVGDAMDVADASDG